MKKIVIIFIFILSLPLSTFAAGVPFISQAPTARWSDARQQDGCEETSSLMAVAWARNKVLPTGKNAEKLITEIADWELRKYGSYNDTSASSTAERILKTYLKFTNYKVVNRIELVALIRELNNGAVVIAPMDGKKLKNPNFSQGGPDRHMLLITGYDKKTKQFITNDPGTRRGLNYRYSEKILFGAIRDYPTGKHLPMKDLGKNVIIVRK